MVYSDREPRVKPWADRTAPLGPKHMTRHRCIVPVISRPERPVPSAQGETLGTKGTKDNVLGMNGIATGIHGNAHRGMAISRPERPVLSAQGETLGTYGITTGIRYAPNTPTLKGSFTAFPTPAPKPKKPGRKKKGGRE